MADDGTSETTTDVPVFTHCQKKNQRRIKARSSVQATSASSQKRFNSSTIFSFQGHLPQNVQELLERQFQRHHGYGHLDLAIFEAAAEHVIFKEVPERLAYAYLASGIELYGVLTFGEERTLVDLRMSAYIKNLESSTARGIVVLKLVPAWLMITPIGLTLRLSSDGGFTLEQCRQL